LLLERVEKSKDLWSVEIRKRQCGRRSFKALLATARKGEMRRDSWIWFRDTGDLFMSLIHTCELCGADSFHYLTELQRHAGELAASPAEWMPWNYRETLARAELS